MSNILTRKLKVAVIGCGRMGARDSQTMADRLPPGWLPLAHSEAVHTNSKMILSAICDINPESLEAAGNRFQSAELFLDYKALIDTQKPDIVTVATRTSERYEIIQHAIEAGVLGIHAEKPLARNMQDTQKILNNLSKHNVKFTYGTLRRFTEIYRTAKNMVKTGHIGQLQEIIVDFGHSPLMWTHPHSVDLLLFFSECTEVDYVQATCSFNHPVSASSMTIEEDPKIDNAFVQFNNGIRGVITGAPGNNIRLVGSEGHLDILGNGACITLYQRNANGNLNLNPVTIYPEDGMSGTEFALEGLANAIASNSQTGITLAELEANQRILFSIPYSSLNNGNRINPQTIPDEFTVLGKTGDFYA